jgi:RHS repeat-associated protein
MATCYKRPVEESCADGEVKQHFRYDAYGLTKVFDPTGSPVTDPAAYATDRLYTGQRWEAQARVYDYHARFYEPRVARFSGIDPARQFPNPYTYVGWRPTHFVDPTGMQTVPDAGGAVALSLAYGTLLGARQGLVEPSLETWALIVGGLQRGNAYDTAVAAFRSTVMSVVSAALNVPEVAQAIASVLQGGGAMSAANAATNASTVSGPGPTADLFPGSFGWAFSSSIMAGSGWISGGADVTAYLGWFSSEFSAGGMHEAVGGTAFARVASFIFGTPGNRESGAMAGGASASAGFGVWMSNANSIDQLTGVATTLQVQVARLGGVEFSFAPGVYVLAVYPSFLPFFTLGASIARFATFTPWGGTSVPYSQ